MIWTALQRSEKMASRASIGGTGARHSLRPLTFPKFMPFMVDELSTEW